MKKIATTLALIVIVFTSAWAQTTAGLHPQGLNLPSLNKKLVPNFKNLNPTTRGGSKWFAYFDAVSTINGAASSLNYQYLFPDSNIMAYFGTTVGNPWVHNIATVLDPTASMFTQAATAGDIQVSLSDSYQVDSVELWFVYTRNNPDPNIIDTMLIEAFSDNTANNIPIYYFTGMATQFGSDTVRFPEINYSQPQNVAVATNKVSYKIPMDAAFATDTNSLGWNYITVNTSALGTINAAGLVAATAKFIPGYTYSMQDTLSNLNECDFASLEEITDQFQSYTPGEYNCSLILPVDVRYNIAGTWNNFFIPSYAYTSATFSYEHHLFWFDVVCNSCFGVGVDETAKSEVLNAYPNPSSDVLYLDNTLNATVNIYSIDGKMIESFISDNKLSKIDVSSLDNGMYMFEVIANGGSSKGKFVINK